MQILFTTFPFFALVLCGYIAGRGRLLPVQAIPGLNSFVLFFALPCMLFRFGADTPLARLLDARVFATYLLCALALVALATAATRRGRIGWNDASFGALVAAFPNSGFMGVPVIVALLGGRAAAPAIVALAVDLVLTSSLCIALSRLDSAEEHGVRHATAGAARSMALNPLPWAILLGGAASATGFVLPRPIQQTVGMLADAASPTALFTIGAVLARSQLSAAPQARGRGWGDVPLLVFVKLVAHPLAMGAMGGALMLLGIGPDRFSLTVLMLVAALPSASNVPMLAERFGADTARVAHVVLATTALAFLSFSGAVALLR